MHRSGFVSMPSFAPAFLSRKKKGKGTEQARVSCCLPIDGHRYASSLVDMLKV